MKRPLIIFGTGKIAETASVYFDDDSDYELIAFAEDQPDKKATSLLGKPVLSFSRAQQLYPPGRIEMFLAVGYKNVNRSRAEVFDRLDRLGYEFASYVSSRTHLYRDSVTIGRNCFILEQNTIQPFVEIGDNVTLWSGNHIGHHSKIGDHSFVTSHVCVGGQAQIGNGCFLGMNSTIRDGISLGRHCLVGAGTYVPASLPDNAVCAISKPGELRFPSSPKPDA